MMQPMEVPIERLIERLTIDRPCQYVDPGSTYGSNSPPGAVTTDDQLTCHETYLQAQGSFVPLGDKAFGS